MKKTVCVDLDGVLAEHDEWRGVDHFGKPFPGAKAFLERLREHFEVVIFTCRCNLEMCRPEAVHLLRNRVAAWLDANELPYDDIYTGQGKPVAILYIDDRAVLCEPAILGEAAYEYALKRAIQEQEEGG